MFLLALLCCTRPQPPRQVEISLSWPGATAEEVQERLTLPLEGAALQIGSRVLYRSRSLPGRAWVNVPSSRLSPGPIGDAVRELSLPDGAQLDVRALPTAASDWIVPEAEAVELVAALDDAFDSRTSWSDTLSPPGLQVVLPHTTPLPALAGPWPDAAALLDDPWPDGGSLRTRAVAVRPLPPRVWARYDGEPVALVHVARAADEVQRWLDARGQQAEPVPAGSAVHVASWGTGDGAARAERIASALRSAGAAHVLVVVGRPLGAAPVPGRAEVVARWDGDVPELSLAPGEGERIDLTRWPVVRRVVRGPAGLLAELAPPPGVAWDVTVDPDRATAAGLDPERISEVLALATSGRTLRVEDGSLVEIRIGEVPETLAALGDVIVGEHDGEQVQARQVADLAAAGVTRALDRYDGAPAAFTTGEVPEGAEIVAEEPPSDRYPW